ncbi:hypothetical protein [Streptomyces arboris]|uniref:hypothetical protein n=1 Tax=Streptomyces arboris TaxID=2600619 RepID=UPI00363863C3
MRCGRQGKRSRTRADADQYAAALEDVATHGLPSIEACTPWEDLREAQLARLAAQRPAVAPAAPQHDPRRARIVFSDAAAKQVEAITSEAEIRAVVVISVDPKPMSRSPAAQPACGCASTPTTWSGVRLMYWIHASYLVVVAYIEV